MIFKIPHFLILFAPENHFFTEVSTSTKKNLKAEMANFPTKMSELLCHSHAIVVGVGSNKRLILIHFLHRLFHRPGASGKNGPR